jgi:hypothetical protein
MRGGPSLIVNGIVTNEGLKLDEEGAVEVIVLGGRIIVARESLDGVDVVPERQHLEMRDPDRASGSNTPLVKPA